MINFNCFWILPIIFKVNEIKSVVIPEINEDFFKDLGYDEMKTTEELEAEVEDVEIETETKKDTEKKPKKDTKTSEDKKEKKKSKDKKESYFASVGREMKKVVWPSFGQIVKYSFAVILFCVVLCLFFEGINLLAAFVKGMFE